MNSMWKDGQNGEKIVRCILQELGWNVFQIDWMGSPEKGQYVLTEVKYQEIFEPPPFYGHGLPLWQIKERLRFEFYTGIRVLFCVVDKSNLFFYYQWLDQLEKSKDYIDTKGKKPRRVYNIQKFWKRDSDFVLNCIKNQGGVGNDWRQTLKINTGETSENC